VCGIPESPTLVLLYVESWWLSLWGKPALVELTLELYFSVLYVDEEEPVVLRGERVVDKE